MKIAQYAVKALYASKEFLRVCSGYVSACAHRAAGRLKKICSCSGAEARTAAGNILKCIKKADLKKAAAVAVAVASAFAGITFMVTSEEAQAKESISSACVSSSVPCAGLSTDTLLSAISTESFSVDFISVSSVTAANTQQQEETIAEITENVALIETYVIAAGESAGEYSAADEAYRRTLDALDKAGAYLEAAQASGSYVLASMYAQDVDELLLEAAAASEEAAAIAQQERLAEEEAAAAAAAEAAAEKEAAEKAAEEAAAEKAAEEAAAEAAAQEAAEKAAAEAAAAAAAQEAASEIAESSDAAQLRQALVDYALSFVGVTPYRYGGSSLTNGADCSGFTMAVYAYFGYSLSHSSSSQASAGRSVSLSEIQPGDLVCYSGHVGIYVGNGQIVHAPGSGRYVCVESMYIKSIRSIRRIIE